MRRLIVIASKGRPEELRVCTSNLLKCLRPTDRIIASVTDEGDVTGVDARVEVVVGQAGASFQRNRALADMRDAELIFFFDDDTCVAPEYLDNCERVFAADPTVVGVTGRVVYDGAHSGPVDWTRAFTLLDTDDVQADVLETVTNLYGCNFAVRAGALENVRFDEALPLYSWLEDLDLSRRLMGHGRLVRSRGARCVHLGSPSGGRQSHRRFGYSQVVNPIYLLRKGSISSADCARLVLRPLGANLLGVLGPQGRWRRYRVAGNLLAFLDLARHRAQPSRITEIGERGI